MDADRTIVIGLDGAGFDLLSPWLEKGYLPNVKQVVETGIQGELESILPPVTSPNWKVYLTGKNPGKIGIFWWENIDVENRRVFYPADRKNRNTEFWELIARSEPVGILGIPTTYPPKSAGSFVVSGAPDGENEGYTHPAAVESTLDDEFDYRVLKRHRLRDDPDAAAREILDLIDLRFEAAKHLAREHDVSFLQVSTFYLNSLHHYLWDHEHTLSAWQLVDEHIGDFLDDETNVVLMSDHGSNPINIVFYINTWLEDQGYLELSSDSPGVLYRLGLHKDRIARITARLGIKRTVKRLVPQRVFNRVPDSKGVFDREQKADKIDWDSSLAVASGQGPLYLTLNRDDPDYETARDEIREKLAALTDPAGNPVAEAVVRGEDVYDGPYAREAPDLVIDQADGVHVPGGIGHETAFTDPSDDAWRAENRRYGLFAASGPDVSSGEIDDISILDLAPTLLHLHGCAVPSDMDGAVRTDAFADTSDAAAREVQRTDASNRTRELRRIRQVARQSDL